VVSVVVMSPLIGLAFDRVLFRHIGNSNTTAKLVISPGLLVGIPSLLPVIFGAQNLDATATIFPFFNPNVVYFTCSGRRSTASTSPPSRSPWWCSSP
jgi:branched-subunit amino acid ABC-type transport system permease component